MNLTRRQISRSFFEPGVHYKNPQTPCVCVIPGGMRIGHRIQIHGTIPKNCQQFVVDLLRGNNVAESNIYLDIKSNLEDAKVACNVRQDGEWGDEEYLQDFPFVRACQDGIAKNGFVMTITVEFFHFEIEVNGKFLANVKHREGFDFNKITHCAILGDVRLHSLQFMFDESYSLSKTLRISVPSHSNMGDLYSLDGTVDDDPEKFELNLQSGPGRFEDISFHLSAWFGEKPKLVQKARIDEEWINEKELDMAKFFGVGEDINLKILVDQDSYRWQINDHSATVLRSILSQSESRTFAIEGDLALQRIGINSPTMTYVSEDGELKSLKNFKIHVFGQHVPQRTDLPCAFEDSAALLISIMKFNQTEKFDAILWTDSDSSDVNLQIEIESNDNGEKAMTTKLRRKEHENQIINRKDIDVLSKCDDQFDLLMVNEKSKIRIIVDGIYQSTVDEVPSGLSRFSVPNELQISRILLFV